MFERFASTDLLVATAVAVFAVTALFLLVAGVAAGRRMRGHDVGNRLGGLVGLTGGAALGTMLLFSPDVTVAAPLVLVSGLTAANRWRAGRRAQAGSIVAGTALPVAIGWGLVAANLLGDLEPALPSDVILWLGGALVVGVFGVISGIL